MVNKTLLWPMHVSLGAKMAEYAGWDMPIRYTGIQEEHLAVRQQAGVFDVSHMGELRLCGPGALPFVESILTNRIALPAACRATYSPMCHANGGTVDDLIVYPFSEEEVLLVVNAGNTEKDRMHLQALLPEELTLSDESAEWMQLAVQGPAAEALLTSFLRLSTFSPDELPFMGWQKHSLDGYEALLSRSGYTGGDGFELYVRCGSHPSWGADLWQSMLETGKGFGLLPVGLGARDTLRLEGGLPLYGHELTDTLSPLQAGLLRFVKWDKGPFLGREALLEQFTGGVSPVLTGFVLQERGIPREGCRLFSEEASRDISIGIVSSGGMGFMSGKGIAMGHVLPPYKTPGTGLWMEIREKRLRAEVVALPFHRVEKVKSGRREG